MYLLLALSGTCQRASKVDRGGERLKFRAILHQYGCFIVWKGVKGPKFSGTLLRQWRQRDTIHNAEDPISALKMFVGRMLHTPVKFLTKFSSSSERSGKRGSVIAPKGSITKQELNKILGKERNEIIVKEGRYHFCQIYKRWYFFVRINQHKCWYLSIQ